MGVLLSCSVWRGLLVGGIYLPIIGSHSTAAAIPARAAGSKSAHGCKLYLMKRAPGPTVLFEAGIAATNLNWFHIQETVSGSPPRPLTIAADWAGAARAGPRGHPPTRRRAAALLRAPASSRLTSWWATRWRFSHAPLCAAIIRKKWPACSSWTRCAAKSGRRWTQASSPRLTVGKRLSAIAVPIARFGLARLAMTSLFRRSGRVSGQLAGAAGHGGRHVLSRVTEEVGKMPREVWPVVAAHWSRPSNTSGCAAMSESGSRHGTGNAACGAHSRHPGHRPDPR